MNSSNISQTSKQIREKSLFPPSLFSSSISAQQQQPALPLPNHGPDQQASPAAAQLVFSSSLSLTARPRLSSLPLSFLLCFRARHGRPRPRPRLPDSGPASAPPPYQAVPQPFPSLTAAASFPFRARRARRELGQESEPDSFHYRAAFPCSSRKPRLRTI